MKGTALIIGMTGGIGGATARALAARGFRIRAMHRNAAAQRQRNVEWVQGDAMSAADVMAAAAGAAVIVHAVNPPKYHDWRGLALPMLANTIAAARKTGATIVFPGTLYNYGPDAGELVNEQSPQNPVTRKGRIRAEMEWMLLDASRAGARVIIVRAGDFFGPGAGGNWFSQALVRPGKAVSRVFYPGPHAVGHSWAYLPDLADAIAGLVQRRGGFGAFETFHFEGHWLPRGVEMAEAICTVADLPFRRIRPLPWWAMRALSPFVESFRETLEMRYLWQRPLALDNRKLVAALGSEPQTALHDAVHDTLEALGCLEGGAGATRRPSSAAA